MSSAEAASPNRGEFWKDAFWDFAHLAVLSSFALAQPVFNLLSKNPEFFAARGAPSGDVVSFGIYAVLLPPLIGIALELLVGLVHRRARQALHLLFIAALVALFAAQLLKKAIDASDAVLIAGSVVLGVLAALAYARAEVVRSFLNVLSPAPLVFLFIFLVISPVSKVAFAKEASARNVGGVSRTNVVVVLFDEFPINSLLDRHGRVDPIRYPHFAELARSSTWFRNAYTVYDSTERAQPAIFDGDLPAKDKLPTSGDHPHSIFTLLAKTHRLNVSEEATSVCPRELCKDERLDESYYDRMKSMFDDLGLVWLHVVSPPHIEDQLTSVSENWGNFGGDAGGGGGGAPGDEPNTRSNLNRNRNKRFADWVSKIQNRPRPALDFKHTLMPHVPWQYLPDARQYRRTAADPIAGLSSEAYNDPTQVDSLYQRHLLQAGFADYELGELLRHLKRIGLYDKSLIVVAADHGVAFDLHKRDRRTLTRQNAEEIGPIPFFLKAPDQRKGRIDDALAESIDILPTIFDVLNVNPKVKLDGRSAFSRAVRQRKRIRILQRNTFKPLYFDEADWQRRRHEQLVRKIRLFGDGADGPLRLFRIGPDQSRLFKPLSGFDVSSGAGASFVAPQEFRHVDLRSPTIPVHVTGHLRGIPTGRDLAIAVNGRIEATTVSFHLATSNDVIFAAMVPESSFHQGSNRVELLEIEPGGGLRRLGQA
ncbi:MAG: sulfatase-like hydrolase/transferase [Thermoleophilaceae bacterium]